MSNFSTPTVSEASINPWRVFETTPGKRVVFLPNAPQFTIIAVSNDMCSFLGLSKEQFVGKGVFNAFPDNPADPEANGVKNLRASLQHVLQHKTAHRMERQRYDVAIEGGTFTEIYWQNHSVPVFDDKGEICCIIHTAEDITEQVLAERQQEKIEGIEKAYHLFMQAPMVIGIAKGDDYVLELANEEALKLWGKTADIIGKPLCQSIPELKDQGVFELFDAVRKTDRPYTGKQLPITSLADGKAQTYYYDVIYQPFYEKGIDEPIGVFTVSYDVTEQVITRQKLEEKEKALEAALDQVRLSKEAAELGTFDMDLIKGTMHWDERCRVLFGIHHTNPVTYERDFVCGLHPDDRERITRLIDNLFIKSISNGDYDVQYRTVGQKDGMIRWVRAKGKVYFNSEEEPVRFIGSVLDITGQVMALQKIEKTVEERTKELAQANEALQAINKELQRSNANLEEFAHAASHDLKEPVRKIHFFTNQLKEQLAAHLTEADLRSFNRIENASQRMSTLIDDLLLYSHVSQRPHEKENINLNKKVQTVLEELELDMAERNAVVHVEKLPVVKGYKRQLQQMFQNLISNALKYSKTDVTPHIGITADEVTEGNNRYHLISVKDNGIGFEPAYAEKIFQMFTRLHGKGEYSGTGVGLSIVKKVVENHNGFIQVESVPGEGSTFLIYLPV